MRNIIPVLIMALSVTLPGCAGINPVDVPAEVVNKPLGTESIKIGMTKDQVRDIWGDPDRVNYVEDKEMWGGAREEWVYRGRTSALPIDAGYLSKTKRLYFDGDNLTNIETD